MKNINPATMPNFHGFTTEDRNTFLFKFVVYRTYDYVLDAQKLKNFPSTLKYSYLRWFMSVEGNNIASWKHLKHTFIEKYKDYYKDRDTRDEIFRMTQGEN